jgi:hypothetical protein
MLKLLIACVFLVFVGLPHGPVHAASFAVEDLSGTQSCMPIELWNTLSHFADATRCSSVPVNTVAVVVTPEAEELPLECKDFEGYGQFCNFAFNAFLAASYQNKWYARTERFDWMPVADLSQIPPESWTNGWIGNDTIGLQFFLGFLDLPTGQATALPDGAEVYLAIAPAGTRNFTPQTVKKIYPVTTP